MKAFTKIVLKSGKDRSVSKFHPWIFSGAIKKIYGFVKDGDVVEVFNNKEEFLGIGHYQIGTIAVRVFSFEQIIPDEKFWNEKIKRAVKYREIMNIIHNESTNVFRLLHGEGDGMPGFVCDYYAGNLVFQFHSIGMFLMRNQFVKIIKDIFEDKITSIYNKSENTLPNKYEHDEKCGFLFGKADKVIVKEYNNKYQIDFEEGQKTGFFIDQRENRKLLEKYTKGANVLNTFCYTGGFSVAALKGGAKLVHSVDSSAKATDLTRINSDLNFDNHGKHHIYTTDAFKFLENMKSDYYDVIVLDPPAFAKHYKVVNQAIKGYQRINKQAFDKIKRGGFLFTFSCTQVVSKEIFRKAIFEAAAQAKRTVKIIHQLDQPADHPVNIYHPEGEYLKGLVLYVE